ncbi:MAG: ATP phosphoribosyltransferase [Chloroflexi bacterium]|nr:ATP phosphoribosyltransferase [Chloroflexota bacterium]
MAKAEDVMLRLALPSKGALEKPAMDFLGAAGLRVHKPNERQYSATIPSAPGVEVIFQRVTDIFDKVEEGSVDLGVTGFDVMSENTEDGDDVVLVQPLGFGRCELVLAVPESWVDVASLAELADLATMYKEKGRELRIATKYRNLTRAYLYQHGLNYFSLVEADGALEVAPSMGYADMIADITSSGTTLRENRLKMLDGGTILKSEAVLIGNRRTLLDSRAKLHQTRLILELIEAHLRARKFLSITANMRAESAEGLARLLAHEPKLAGLMGPSIAPVYGKTRGEQAFAVTIVVEQGLLLPTVDHLRQHQGTDITVFALDYFFAAQSSSFENLVELLKRQRR